MEPNSVFNHLYKIGTGNPPPMWIVYVGFAIVAALVLANALIIWRERRKS
jgi:hypothetical protein